VAIGSVVVAAGEEFALTTGIDRGADFTGGAGNDSFSGAASTLTALDALDGGAGSDSLTLTSATAITQTASTYTVSNIETASAVSGGVVTLDTTKWVGLTDLNISSLTGMVITASATTNVVGTDVGVDTEYDGEVTVNGGNNVTLTLVADDAATDGDSAAEISVGATTAAAGNVSVSLTGAYASNVNNAMSNIAVTGGTSVNVSTSAGLTAAQVVAERTANTDNNTVTQSAIAVTGNESTTSVTVTQDAAVVLVSRQPLVAWVSKTVQ